MLKLQVIIASTRPSRKGPIVADWIYERAQQSADFEVELIDLAEVNLPLFDESNHPRLQKYEHEHTLRWSAIVERADAFIFVTSEYNYGAPPSLVNALTYLSKEWSYKPAAFVSYGGVSGGTRSVQMCKQSLTTLGVMPIPQAVSIPFFTKHIDSESNQFVAEDIQNKSADTVLKELARWAQALKGMRT